MTNKLISLVFLFFLIMNNAYSDNEFIFPVKKPSIFKKFENKADAVNKNLPQSKPKIINERNEKPILVENNQQKKTIESKLITPTKKKKL